MTASLARTGAATGLMAAVVAVLAALLGDQSPWLAGGVAMVGGTLAYAGLSLALGSGEPRAVWHLLRRRR